jgi:amino acid adenylation domain-containing protein
MNLVEFLKDLSLQSVTLFVDGDRLRYHGPKEVLTPIILEKIKHHKTEILQLLREGIHTSRYYRLAHGQRGLWFLYKLAPESAAYNIPFTARIRSNLNVPALQRAFSALIVRHPTLRTTFGQQGDEPFQEVHQYQEVCFEKTNASTFNWDDLTSKVIEAYQRPFDLEQGPVLRVSLFTRSAQDYILLLTIHHIAIDGFSFGILLDELRLLYQGENAGCSVSLPSIDWQYTDYVQWQTQMLASPAGEKLWDYWYKQFAGELPVLNLPTDRPRPPVQNQQGASYTFEVTKELTSKLRENAKALGATLYMTLLTAFVVLLHRLSGQEDIIVGSPINNRSQPEFEQTVGFFVNMLALRVDISGNPTFLELLTQVRRTVLAGLLHQDYPSPLLIQRLQLKRDPSLLGLFRVSFNLFKLQQSAEILDLFSLSQTKAIADWGGLSLEPFTIPQQEGQNDLVFDMMETTESLVAVFRYNTDLFDATTMSRMAGHFQTLLTEIVANPQQPVSKIPLLTEAEQHRLLVEWNNTKVDYPQPKSIHQLLEAQVELTPNAVAVVFQDSEITYQELNTQANQLAYHLQAMGVKPEVLVGICVERSIEMVVGLLAILKAGGAYVPLDPTYPQERLEFMLSDSQVSVLLTQEKLIAQLPEHNAHLVCLDTNTEIINTNSQENLVNEVTPENLAYVIYTSGSTGIPKGVMITHHSLVNAYFSWEDAYQLRKRTSSHLQMASFSFDVFSGDLVRALCSGAKLVLCPRESLLVPEKLYELMLQQKVDCAEFVPVVLRNLIEYLKTTKQNLNFMRLLVVGSDSWYVKEYEEFRHFCGIETRLINSYGVSEATIDSCYFESAEINQPVDELVPIGRPMNNTQIYILDQYLQPVPIGVSGELHIGGTGLARGYQNLLELTKEKFIPNPFSNQSEHYLYRTGDLARYLPDGNIELLGRIDNQEKIRGFRIELGEIEAILTRYPQVKETVVIAREDQPGNKRLVAYIVFKQKQPTTNKLRSFLKQKLPEYMLPNAFVILDALPLLPNNKVDRTSLPAPDTSSLSWSANFVQPRDTLELQLAQIWSEVLDVYPVGIWDNFFDKGGHSLLAVRLMSKIQQQFGKNLPLATLFQSPTVEQLANILRCKTDSQLSSPLVAIQPAGQGTPLFCIHPVGGNVFCYMDLVRHLGTKQPVYGLQSPGLNGEQKPLTSIEDMATYYIEVLQTVQPQGPYHLGGWSFGGVVAFEMAQQLYQQGHEVALLALIDSYAPIAVNMFEKIDEKMLVVYLVKDLGGLFGRELPLSIDELQPLNRDELLNSILEQAKLLNILPSELGLEQMQRMLQVFQTNYQAAYRYIPKPYPGRITLFCSSEKVVEVTQEDPSQGWDKLADCGLEISKIPGDHYTIVREPHVQILAQQMRTKLNQIHKA